MSVAQNVSTRILRAAFALCVCSALFLILPLVNVVFRSFSQGDTRNVIRQASLTKVVQEEKKPEQAPKRTLRKLSLPSRRNLSRNMSSKFTPDLSIGGAGDGAVVASEQNLENIVYEEGQTDEPPEILYSVAPKYPRQARNQGVGGVVAVVIVIDRAGNPSHVSFDNLPHEMFRRPVEEAVFKWRFKPAHHRGVPVRIRVRQEFDFGVVE
jgi:TonB family protein